MTELTNEYKAMYYDARKEQEEQETISGQRWATLKQKQNELKLALEDFEAAKYAAKQKTKKVAAIEKILAAIESGDEEAIRKADEDFERDYRWM